MSADWRKRLALAIALGVAGGGVMSQTQALDPLPYARGLATLLPLAWWSSEAGQTVAAAAMVCLLGLFVAGRRAPLAGWGFFVIVLVLHAVVRSVHPDETDRTQGAQMPCATLVAWLVGSALAPRLGREPDELGGTLACGVVGAGYTMAALSKLLASGLGWVDGPTLALMIYERGTGAGEPFETLRHAIGTSPRLCAIGMAGALAMEASGWLFVFRTARRPYAMAAFSFHLTSGLLLGYPHFDWAFTTLAWAWAAGGSRARPRGPSAPAAPMPTAAPST